MIMTTSGSDSEEAGNDEKLKGEKSTKDTTQNEPSSLQSLLQPGSSLEMENSENRFPTSSPSTGIFPLPTISIQESPPLLVMSLSERASTSLPVVKHEGTNHRNEEDEKVVNSEKNSPSESASLQGINKKDEETPEMNNGMASSAGNYIRVQKHVFADRFSQTKPSKELKNFKKASSEDGKLNEIQAEDLENRLKALAAAFSARTTRTKEKITQPPTPSSDESETEDSKAGEPSLLDRLKALASHDTPDKGDGRRKSFSEKVKGRCLQNLDYFKDIFSCNYILDPQSTVYVSWMLVVAIVFLYNAWVIPLRSVFPYQTENNVNGWFLFDCIADFIYVIDVVAFKPHVKFIQSGLWVKEPKQTMLMYLKTVQFKIDLMALFPADIFASIFHKNIPLLRVPRLLKIETFWELFRRLDTILANPHRARIFHTCLYMLFMIHMTACSYYGLSTWEGIGTTTWTFDGRGNAYIRCFYFATKTATSIGKNPKPENELEYVFMTFAWLSGVFVFALLIGQIRDIIATATKSKTEYRILTSATVSYLHRLGVPERLQNRVKIWLSYTWEQQKTLDETKILQLLPKTMKAEIALNIHVETLAKVQLFQDCETAFLRDLVVKLRSIIILPGDFVCRKGEIGREMFIVKSGKIQVIGGPSGTQVLVTLSEGSVFGEIALLGIGGMNKRTADVRAAGFVNLFVLNKSDLNEAIRDYPEAQEIMQKKAKKLMKENIKKAKAALSSATTSGSMDTLSSAESEVIIKNKVEPPQLIKAVLKLFPPTTKVGQYLTQGSKVNSETNVHNLPKQEDIYSSFTSYPPSPFIPTSGHISPQLDISIMTGDSSDKLLSPPNDSLHDVDDEEDVTDDIVSFSDGYRSEPDNENDAGPNPPDDDNFNDDANGNENNGSHLSSEWQVNDRDSEKIAGSLRASCTLHPFPRKKDIKVDGNRRASYMSNVENPSRETGMTFTGARNSCPHFESSSMIGVTGNRDEIPIELRPPLYILDPDISNRSLDGRKSTGTLVSERSTIGRTSGVEKNAEKQRTGKRRTTPAIIASRFISDLGRGPLQRQVEVDMPDVKVNIGTNSSYSLDMDSD